MHVDFGESISFHFNLSLNFIVGKVSHDLDLSLVSEQILSILEGGIAAVAELDHLDVLLLLDLGFAPHVFESSVGQVRLLVPDGLVAIVVGFLGLQLLLQFLNLLL